MLAIRLPADIESRLNALANETGRTKTYYAREAILKYLDELEDQYMAEKIMENVKSGKEKLHSLDEVERELGLDN
ncbi:ribbon-helix-helix protein, CopG family [Maribrevibacterium harenarium]|uniref:Relaxosome protein TraY n=2 Tax=Maribrevibacterium harenarium TaxID=2589817 RepID=A0A501WQ34_9GAMM|nr:ribbon-helix-helix protein, CopG family [Maribrevibacterium harenarium]